jgi:single-stranded-DNA-specific exonuclease
MHYLGLTKKIVLRPAQSLGNEFSDFHPVIKRVLLARGVQSDAELKYSLSQLPSPWLLSGMEVMVAHLIAAIEQQKRIIIIADFDADGATSCAVAIKGLGLLGANNVSFIVPNRFEYGYGLTPEIVRLAAEEKPDVLITVDNGISSLEGVAVAKHLGMEVLITDHHLAGEVLPEADAIVNPNLPGQEFPSGSLAGVGVIFYVLMALRNRLREQDWFKQKEIKEPNLAQLLDYVALGTVADVVPLDYINRILVYQGLQRMRSESCHPGLKALIEVTGRNQQTITATDLGFTIGPRINAAGRMDDMSLGIQCLLAEELNFAMQMAMQLDDFNSDRKEVEGQMKTEAMVLLKEMKAFDEAHLPAGICLYDENWHQGVVGILASRIKDRLHRPVIAFAKVGDGEIKGSARSILGVHIRDVLSRVATDHPKILSKFGGHAMAAGLSIKISDLPPFSLAFNEIMEKSLEGLDVDQKIYTDGELTEQQFTIEFAQLLQSFGPWGQEFPEPVFEGVFDVIQSRIVGKQHLKLVLRQPFGDLLIDAIAFFVEQPENWLGIRQIKSVYKLDINEYQGARNIQFILQYIEKMA